MESGVSRTGAKWRPMGRHAFVVGAIQITFKQTGYPARSRLTFWRVLLVRTGSAGGAGRKERGRAEPVSSHAGRVAEDGPVVETTGWYAL